MTRYMIVDDYEGIRRIDGETDKQWRYEWTSDGITCAVRWKKRQSDKVFPTFEEAQEELIAELEERRIAAAAMTPELIDNASFGRFLEYEVYAERTARRILRKERER